jgi:hypothetical protein
MEMLEIRGWGVDRRRMFGRWFDKRRVLRDFGGESVLGCLVS